jgi:predicted phosphodiesterase
MKLHVMSDIHLEFWAFEPPPTDADVVVLAGDGNCLGNAKAWSNNTGNGP